ncbi:MAG TPA: DUF4139 domain-containing protein, partial [Dongiaceae bacterium]|nr:DUF4139 domain-containing protein [Dongiaceae bacterium]
NAEVRVDDVAASIDPTSVHFTALDHPDAVAVLEQNYKYDLADPDRLLTRYLDHPVKVTLKERGGTKEGTLLSYTGGDLVLKMGNGASIVNRVQISDVALGEVPGGLVAKPALVWRLASERTGPERVELSYLTDNVTWHAEYVAVVNAKDDGLALNGWVSLDNRSGASYENAKLELVAGDVHRVPRELDKLSVENMDAVSLQSSLGGFEERPFFEYHIYTLDRPATVADRETKQLALFPSASASARKTYTYDATRNPTKIATRMEFQNSKQNGLGMALPAGKVRVYKEDTDKALEFVGEDQIDHTPRDEKLRLFLGDAFDVVAERKQTAQKQLSSRSREESYSVELRNHKDTAVQVQVVEHLYGDWTITEHSHEFVKTNANTVEFPVNVPANGSLTVVYTVRTKY